MADDHPTTDADNEDEYGEVESPDDLPPGVTEGEGGIDGDDAREESTYDE